jgi:anti-anti-sigma factor
MTIKLVKHPPCGVEFRLEGRLDTASAPEVQNTLLQLAQEYEQIELNFAELTYICSAGLRILVLLQKQANRTGSHLWLSHVKPSLLEVFEITGIGSVLQIR